MIERDRAGEVLRTLEYLFDPGQIIEIRALSSGAISSGYFSDYQKAVAEILIREADTLISGFYVTLNEVNPALLARRANRIQSRMGKADASTADSDIIRRRWLPIDIDPVRPSGVSSSEDEHATALSCAETIRGFLATCGWPDPLLADSGNGAHLLYPIDLPNNEESKGLVRQVLEILDIRFSTAGCRVDTANFNAARIWKVYGTISRKGDNLPDRPHRRSKVISMPPKERVLFVDGMKQFITEYHTSAPDTGAKQGERNRTEAMAATGDSVLDLAKWLDRNNLTYLSKPYQGGTLFVLDSCPFSDDHKDGAFAIQFANGAIFAGCHHDSCGGGRQRWPELRARFEPSKPDIETRLARMRSERIRAKYAAEHDDDDDYEELSHGAALHQCSLSRAAEVESPGSSHSCPDDKHGAGHDALCAGESEGEDEGGSDDECGDRCECHRPSSDGSIQHRSREILAHGSPLNMMLQTFSRYHEGDQTVAECLVHSLASRSVINSRGLHVSITGESGKGKSHAIETMKSLIPPEYRLDGRMSDKALFYMDDLVPGTVITLDDVSLSDQMQEILKGVTTSFQKPFPYRTVNTERKPQICTIPERCIWWIAKVEGSGDDQVFNRMLTCWIDDSEEQDQKVLDRTLAGAEEMPEAAVRTDEDLRVCRQIWDDLSQVFVVIPYARRIRFQSAENRRNPDMLLDLIRTNAALCQLQREKTVSRGTACVIATVDDFNEASRLFVILNGETGGQATKLTRRESALIETIATADVPEHTIRDLQQATGWTNSSITKLLHGYRSHGKTYSGILEKCPAVSYLDRTVSVGDEGYTTQRRNRVYLWDTALYHDWMKGGSVWITGGDRDGTSEDPGDDQGPSVLPGAGDEAPSLIQSDGVQSDTPEESDQSQNLEHSGVSLSSINPHDFVRMIEGPDRRRCSVCAKKRTRYQQRIKRDGCSDTGKNPVVLCESCYAKAVSKEVSSRVLLPGILDTATMVKRSVPSGRCQLCNLHPAVWSDSESRIDLCDSCYHRCRTAESPGHPEKGYSP